MFGLFEGPSSQQKQQYNLLNSQTNFATDLGQGNLSLSSGFFRDLLSNPTKALAPEISASQNMQQQAAKTNVEFGTRSGGTAGANQAAAAKGRGDIINLMGKTQTGAAENLSSSGQNLLSTGVQGAEAGFGEAKTMQEQKASMWNDIIKSVTGIVGGGVAGLFKGGGATSDIVSAKNSEIQNWLSSNGPEPGAMDLSGMDTSNLLDPSLFAS